jgi:hypothetical protein
MEGIAMLEELDTDMKAPERDPTVRGEFHSNIQRPVKLRRSVFPTSEVTYWWQRSTSNFKANFLKSNRYAT